MASYHPHVQSTAEIRGRVSRPIPALFALLNRLVDSGALATLSNAEAKALIPFLRHADANGVAYPGAELIGEEIGTTGRQAQKLISSLTKKGFLQTIDGGAGGYGRKARRQIAIPDTTAASDVLSSADTASATDAKPRLPRHITTAMAGTLLRPPATGEQHIEGHREQLIEQHNGFFPADSLLPTALNTPAFKTAWEQWQQHRREKKRKLTPLAAKKQLEQLAAMGESRAIAAIETSITAGWTGIFDRQDNNNGIGTRNRQRGIVENLSL